MSSRPDDDGIDPQPAPRGSAARFLKIVLLVLALLIGGVTITAVLAGEDREQLPFDYEGFD